jgi:hypothetical protein
MTYDMTMLDLVNTVTGYARSEAEVIATVVLLVDSGAVRLCGNFKGMRFEDALCAVPSREGGVPTVTGPSVSWAPTSAPARHSSTAPSWDKESCGFTIPRSMNRLRSW